MAISVALVDDHAVVREAVAGMLAAQGGIDIVGQAGSLSDGHALLDRLLATPPDGPLVAVVDVTMPDGSGLSLVRAARERSKDIGLVVLTMLSDDSTLLEALDAGASALVRKSAPSEQVISAVRRAAV
ncbi:MAG TPA: response regulator transcription factor, partial [Ornithinibacter sp.]|nr:response regulator transcription factor [Ornithinibacter sp.]